MRMRWSYTSRKYRSVSSFMPGMSTTPVARRASMSRWGVMTLRQSTRRRFSLKSICSWASSGRCSTGVLELVDPVVERAQPGEEAVGERVEHEVEQLGAPGRRRRLHGRPPPQVVERRAGVPVHGDQEALAEEAVDLHQPVLVLVGAVGDDQREVAEGVDLGPLAEVVHVLHRQRVEAEDVGEKRQVLGGGLVEVEPEELVVREVLVQAARGPRDRGRRGGPP